jgi:hypothetical protein
MTRPDHVFIVGMARTGSTLTRTLLNCSKDIGIAGESHFFRYVPRLGLQTKPSFQKQFAKVGDISTDAGAEIVVDYIFNNCQKGFWNLRGKDVNREEFLRRLLESDRSERALLDLVMASYAKGKPIRGEKTPAHIYFVPKLLKWFPNAKIVHTFRDPRAIYISNRKKSAKKNLPLHSSIFRRLGLLSELYASLIIILTWSRFAKLHQQYQQLYPDNYYLSKFEDLVSDPRGNLQKLCNFLEVEFVEDMLEQTFINSSYLPKGQTTGFDFAAVDRWRKYIDPAINKWFILWCKKYLVDFNYQI